MDLRILSGIWGSKGGLLSVVNGDCRVLIWGIDSCVIFGLSAVLDAVATCLGERGCCGSCNGVGIEFEPIEDEMIDDIEDGSVDNTTGAVLFDKVRGNEGEDCIEATGGDALYFTELAYLLLDSCCCNLVSSIIN